MYLTELDLTTKLENIRTALSRLHFSPTSQENRQHIPVFSPVAFESSPRGGELHRHLSNTSIVKPTPSLISEASPILLRPFPSSFSDPSIPYESLLTKLRHTEALLESTNKALAEAKHAAQGYKHVICSLKKELHSQKKESFSLKSTNKDLTYKLINLTSGQSHQSKKRPQSASRVCPQTSQLILLELMTELHLSNTSQVLPTIRKLHSFYTHSTKLDSSAWDDTQTSHQRSFRR